MGALRRLILRFTLPTVWRIFPNRAATALHDFADVEADSAWQFLRALEQTDQKDYRNELFGNALEEVYHSEVFRKLANACGGVRLNRELERRQLFDSKSGNLAFMALHYVGEGDVARDFNTYAAYCPIPRIAETFRKIQGDEHDHEELAWRHLVHEAGSYFRASWEVLKIRFSRHSAEISRAARSIAGFLLDLILGGLIVIFFSLAKRGTK